MSSVVKTIGKAVKKVVGGLKKIVKKALPIAIIVGIGFMIAGGMGVGPLQAMMAGAPGAASTAAGAAATYGGGATSSAIMAGEFGTMAAGGGVAATGGTAAAGGAGGMLGSGSAAQIASSEAATNALMGGGSAPALTVSNASTDAVIEATVAETMGASGGVTVGNVLSASAKTATTTAQSVGLVVDNGIEAGWWDKFTGKAAGLWDAATATTGRATVTASGITTLGTGLASWAASREQEEQGDLNNQFMADRQMSVSDWDGMGLGTGPRGVMPGGAQDVEPRAVASAEPPTAQGKLQHASRYLNAMGTPATEAPKRRRYLDGEYA